jgi:integrase
MESFYSWRHGRRHGERPSGFFRKTARCYATRQVCYDLMRTDSLVPLKGQEQRFEDFAKGWWEWDTCEYLVYRRSRRKISPSYAVSSKCILKNHILPYFGKKRMKEITNYSIERWMIAMQETGVKNASVNVRLACLRTMLGFAEKKGMIKDNPAKKVEPLQNTSRVRGILSTEEVQILFDAKRITEIWEERIFYVMNLLSACTGMRMGEVIAVRGVSLQDGSILVDKQYTRMYGLGETKTYDCRQIPLPENPSRRAPGPEGREGGRLSLHPGRSGEAGVS